MRKKIRKMNLNKLNVQELSVEEAVGVDGGIVPIAIAIAVALFFLLGTASAK